MNQRFLSLCGVIAPLLFVFMTILGGANRPGYSHLSDTVSELLSPGSPNKLLLDCLLTIFALLLVCFGFGILQFVRRSRLSSRIGSLGASFYIAMGVVSLATATIFPQDARGSAPTFQGQMHIYLSGVVGILSILFMLLIGLWFRRTGIFPAFGTFSFITIGVVVLSAGFFVAQVGSPIMGLAERISIIVGFLWTFSLGLWMSSRKGYAG
jgi:hypothetical membrane protein